MRVTFYLMIILAFSSCSKYLELDLPFEGTKLVVNGVLVADQFVDIRVSKTTPATGPITEDLSVQGAQVTLWSGGQPLEILEDKGGGVYRSEYKPVAGNSYLVEVYHPDFGQVTSTSQQIPFPLQLTEVDFSIGAVDPLNEDTNTGALRVGLTDTTLQAYYAIDIQGFSHTEEVFVNAWRLEEAPEVNTSCGFVGGNDTFDFSKACFNGDLYQTTFGVETTGWLDGEYVECTHLLLSVASISEEYYRYLETSVQPEGIDLAFVEPQVVASNVQGGYGIVVAANSKIVRIDL